MPDRTNHILDVPAGEPGRSLRLIRRRGGGLDAPPIVLLHGSSFPGSICYAVPIGGRSFMELLADRGHDVWALDFRGYGGSWKPDDDGSAVADTAQAVDDLAIAVDAIRSEAGVGTVDLFGWSWGAAVAGSLAVRSDAIRRVVFFAPQWLRDTPSPMVTPEAMTRSYREVAAAGLVDRLAARVGGDFLAPLAAHLADSGPLVVPTGSARDIAADWMSGRPTYDPAAIVAPTLVAVGSDDVDTPPAMAREIFQRLGGSGNELALVPEATHYGVFEPARERLLQAVHAFLVRTETD